MTAERFPEGDQERLRLYRRRGGLLACVATCEDAQALGVALLTLYDEGTWEAGDRVGVYRAAAEDAAEGTKGEWIVNPYISGEAPLESRAAIT